jgi:hypothetical protein
MSIAKPRGQLIECSRRRCRWHQVGLAAAVPWHLRVGDCRRTDRTGSPPAFCQNHLWRCLRMGMSLPAARLWQRIRSHWRAVRPVSGLWVRVSRLPVCRILFCCSLLGSSEASILSGGCSAAGLSSGAWLSHPMSWPDSPVGVHRASPRSLHLCSTVSPAWHGFRILNTKKRRSRRRLNNASVRIPPLEGQHIYDGRVL